MPNSSAATDALIESRWEDFYSFKADTASRLSALEKQSAVDGVHRDNVERRLTEIEGGVKWIQRLLIGGFLMAVIGWIVNGGIAIGG